MLAKDFIEISKTEPWEAAHVKAFKEGPGFIFLLIVWIPIDSNNPPYGFPISTKVNHVYMMKRARLEFKLKI